MCRLGLSCSVDSLSCSFVLLELNLLLSKANQKRPDVHKIVLSIKSRFPPHPPEKCQF